ncbi:pre-toxin TG domain-containing protein, partial [Anaeromyxobacter sp. SG66]|uniref:pre-toxin TG domain-containing protein n=1 Tax=Anaeromyxobacter sp. SG66 TaxID=2925410 RepID=UPI001F5A5027
PASTSFRTLMICSSVNLLFRIRPPRSVEDSRFDPSSFRGAGQLVQLHPAIAANVVLSGEQATGGKASLWDRFLAGVGIVPIAGVLKFAKGTLVEHAAEILARAHIRDDEVIKVLVGHFPNAGRSAVKSVFYEGTDFLQLVETAVRSDSKTMYESGGRLVVEHAFDAMIGIDKSGQATNKLRVVLEPNGQVVTAFPFL